MSILDLFPGEPRDVQVQALTELESQWPLHNVFAVSAPVASGKSRIAYTLGQWLNQRGTQSAILTPNNLLVKQYADEFPDLARLSRRDSYSGPTAFSQARGAASSSPLLLANYHTWAGNRLYRDTAIFDEAHNLVPVMQERWSKKLWQREWDFPDDLETVEDFVLWAETASVTPAKDKQLRGIVRDVVHDQNYTLEHTEELWRGKADRVLLLKPLTVRDLKPWMWNHLVRRIVLLSATLSEWEIYELGLDRRRVCYINVDSCIPPSNRPVVATPLVDMGYANRATATEQLAKELREILETRRDKGLIHCTYDVAARLRRLLSHERLFWHTKADKLRQYDRWRGSDSGVLVASGMSEGIDLAYAAARWQVVCEVPYPSLADSAVANKAARQPDWYQWETVKALLQTIGRVCRAPDDFGWTDILDSRFPKFFSQTRKMWPQHVANSVSLRTRESKNFLLA